MKLMWLRYASACNRCVAPLAPNSQAWWDGVARVVVCLDCEDVGHPPLSAVTAPDPASVTPER